MLKPWFRFSLDTTMLAVEAQRAIAMRLTSAALGLEATLRIRSW